MTPLGLSQLGLLFLASALGCLLFGRQVIRQLVTWQWIQPVRHEDCPPLLPIQQTKHGTPTMGGLLVLGVAVVSAIGFGGLSAPEGWVVLGALVSVGALGMVDDLLKFRRPNAKGIRATPKLVAALGVGGVIGWLLADPAFGYRQVAMPWLAHRVDLGIWWIPFVCLVMAGCAHAVNLTDGMDGLAVGCLAVAFGAIGLLTLMPGIAPVTASLASTQRLVAIWCVSLAGACVGFLWFNSFPASVFLGDVGALGLGAALGVLALLSRTAVGLVILGGVFVVEAASVMLQVASYRWRNKRRIFRVAPLHHHFQVGGMSEQKLVVRFWVVGLLLAALGLTALGHS